MFSCFTEAELRQHLAGSLAGERQAGAEEHLRTCRACALLLEQVLGPSSPGSSLPSASRAPHWPTRVDYAEESLSSSAGDGPARRAARPSDASEPDMHPASPAAASSPVSLSIDEFLQTLSQSGILAAQEIESVREQAVADPETGSTTADLINWLIKQEKLTAYQADLLVRGRANVLVLGNYVILNKLGQGGMGTVFLARHRRMNREVALKVLPAALSKIPEAIARFQREVQAAAKLQHAHIAAAYDADEAEGVHFLVMEHVDGPNLAAYVREKGALPVAAAVRLIGQAAAGLAAAHSEGIVHRDIKPSNLMVNRQGALKVLDLGLAQMRDNASEDHLTSDVTQTGRTMGTVDYMAPEQARDAKTVDARADIYSLGCTLYFLLAGRTPAPPGSAAEKLLWHQTQYPPPLIDLCDGCTARLESLVKRMMAKDADVRPQSMTDVALELEACLAEMPAGTEDLSLDGIEIRPSDLGSTAHGSRAGRGTQLNAGDTLMSAARMTALGDTRPTRAQSRGRYVALIAGGLGLAVLLAVFVLPRMINPAGSEQALLIVAAAQTPAEVYLDGRLMGQIKAVDQPLVLRLAPKDYLVRVERLGFQPYEKQVRTRLDKPENVVAMLQRDQTLPPPIATTPGVSPHAPYEKLLAWVWQQGGSIEVKTTDGHPLNLTALDQLPREVVEIAAIRLDGSGVRDKELAILKAAPRLVELSLADTKITDDGLVHLARLEELTRLNLSRTGVRGPGLAHLGRMSRLTVLDLQCTPITDQALGRIAGLPKLQWLHLADTGVTDLGIEQLKTMKSLELVTLNGTGLTQAGHDELLAALGNLKIHWDGADLQRAVAGRLLDKGATLAVAHKDRAGERLAGLRARNALPMGRVIVKEVDLSTGAGFGDDDLKQLVALAEIESLNLVNVNLTPAGIAHVQGLATLKSMQLAANRLPAAVIEAFQQALPQCQVVLREPVDAEVARAVLARKGRVTVVTDQGIESAEVSATEALPAEMYSIRAINLSDAQGIDDAALANLHELAQLESLVLSGTDVTDEGLNQLAGCKSLRSLTLSDTKITAAGVAALARLPALVQLFLARTDIGDEGVRRAASLPGLTHLSLQGVVLTDDTVARLKRLDSLQWLDLSATPITAAACVHLAQLDKLQSLNVKGTKLTDAAVEELAGVFGAGRVTGDPPDAQRLAARWIVENKGTVVLSTGPLKSLRDLPPDACQIVSINLATLDSLHPDDIVKHVSACAGLTSLDLSGSRLNDDELRILGGLTELTTLSLAEMTISDKALKHLAPLARLRSLDLTRTHVTGSGLADLAGATDLAQLNLTYAPVKAEHLAKLATFTKLRTLDLSAFSASSSLIDDDALAHLAALPGLKVLGLRSAKITDDGLARVAKLADLESLDLEGTPITDTGVAKLEGLSKLSRISLTRTGVTDEATTTLAKLKSLRSIALKQTSITPEAIATLQRAFGPKCEISGPTPTPRDPSRTGNSDAASFGQPTRVISGSPQ